MVEEWLKTLGIDEICQWDVLLFLHRHRTALLSAEHIARFMCYGAVPVITALDYLESKGIVERSRLSQGARLYQVIWLDGPRGHAFQTLMDLSESRAGRRAVTEELHKMSQRATVVLTMHAVKQHEKTNRHREQNPLTSGKECKQWPRAV